MSKVNPVAWGVRWGGGGGSSLGSNGSPLVAVTVSMPIERKLFIPRLVLPLKAARTCEMRGLPRAACSQQMGKFLCLCYGHPWAQQLGPTQAVLGKVVFAAESFS